MTALLLAEPEPAVRGFLARQLRNDGFDVLASDPARVFTREQLLRDVWGFRTYVPTRTLESHASRVRRKLDAAGLPGWVVNVWGVGYKLRHIPSGSIR